MYTLRAEHACGPRGIARCTVLRHGHPSRESSGELGRHTAATHWTPRICGKLVARKERISPVRRPSVADDLTPGPCTASSRTASMSQPSSLFRRLIAEQPHVPAATGLVDQIGELRLAHAHDVEHLYFAFGHQHEPELERVVVTPLGEPLSDHGSVHGRCLQLLAYRGARARPLGAVRPERSRR